MNRSYFLGALFGVLLTLTVLGLYVITQKESPPPPPPPPPPPVSEEIPPAPEPLITAEEYRSLKLGMPYWKVAEIIGDLEDDRYTEDRPGGEFTQPTVIVWCTWKNPDGSSATLGFDLDRLVEKNQSGALPD